MYWTTNNALSITQTLVLKQELVRKYLDIPKPPLPDTTPAIKMRNPITVIAEVNTSITSHIPKDLFDIGCFRTLSFHPLLI